MDSLTHLVAGALTPLAFRNAPRRGLVLAFGIVAGEFPDIDVFLSDGTPEAFLSMHRGITHALLWQPVMALAVVFPFYIMMRARERGAASGLAKDASFGLGPMFLAALLALCLHIYLDCMTTFGTQALLPFSGVRLWNPAMFIVDLLCTLPPLVLLLGIVRREFFPGRNPARRPGAVFSDRTLRLARLGVAWLFLYPLTSLGINALATEYLSTQYAEPETAVPAVEGHLPEALRQSPSCPLPPAHGGRRRVHRPVPAGAADRAVLALHLEGGGGRRPVLPGGHRHPLARPRFERYVRADADLVALLRAQRPLFAHFADFCAFMIQTERPADAQTRAKYGEDCMEYSFMDLRYVASPKGVLRWAGHDAVNFVLEARVTGRGELVAYRYLQDSARTGEPWLVAAP